jgi:Holliday junction resolvasome RuvABC ATP-dependent DNA helicase subunit
MYFYFIYFILTINKNKMENKNEKLLPNILITGTPGVGKTTLCT